MATSKLHTNDIDIYQGIYPTVFKKIDQSDIGLTPFQINKSWTFLSGSNTGSMLPLKGIYTDKINLPAIGSELIYDDAKNIDDSLQSVTYFSIDRLFYKYKNHPYETYGPTDLNRTKKVLFQTASIFSIPVKKVGDGIKPASFSLTATNNFGVYGLGVYGVNVYGNGPAIGLSVKSDIYGNIYDTTYNTGSIISNVKWYDGFNEYFDISRIPYTYSNISFIDGITTTTGYTQSLGLAAKFNGNGYLTTELNGLYNRDTDYTISFFISASNTGSNQIIATKSTNTDAKWPFKIQLSGSNQIIFNSAGSDTAIAQVTSSVTVNNWTHVACQKSGSYINLFIDGVLHASQSSTIFKQNFGISGSVRIDNTSNLFIGGYKTSNGLTGVLDEIRIYNKALTLTEIGYLADRSEGGTLLQTNHVGNVFSKQGLIVISTPDYRFNNLINLQYTGSYKSTLTRYELSTLVKIDTGDFNMSLNPTLTSDDDVTYYNFVTGSNFAPYITTIGLYNDAGQLLAIGKLAQPIQKRNDVDLNFLIRIDLDKNITKE